MASDVMRVRLHLRRIPVLAVVVDSPSELAVEVESTLRRPRCPACGFGCGRVHDTRRRKIRDREVSGRRTTLVWVRLVVSDAHRGLASAAGATSREPDSAAGCTSYATCSPGFPAATSTWPPRYSTHLRVARRRCRARGLAPSPRPARRQLPQGGPADGRRPRRRARVLRVPPDALAQDLVHQPPRTCQQRDGAPNARRGNLPQRSLRHPPRGSCPRRPPRRLAGQRPPLPLSGLHELLYSQRDTIAAAEFTPGCWHRGSTPKVHHATGRLRTVRTTVHASLSAPILGDH